MEIWTDGGITSMGYLHEAESAKRVQAARRARAMSIRKGLFTTEIETTFEFLYHFDTFPEWKTHLETRNWGNPQMDQPLIERAGVMLQRLKGKIVMREMVYAARLRRQRRL